MNSTLKKILPHLTAFVVFLLLSAIFFYPQLQGKKLRQSDVVQYLGMSKEVKDYYERTGERSLWTNSMFGGMPTYQINTVHAGNNLKYADRLFSLFGAGDQPIGRFFAAMIGFYLMLVLLGVNPWLSIAGGIAFGFTTNSILLFETGHLTKFKSLIYFPIMVAGILLAYRKKYIIGGLLFALGAGLNLLSNHPQMVYYLALTLLIFGIARLVHHLRAKTMPVFLKATGTLVLAGLLALGSTASNIMVTMEYQEDTMRGEPILVGAEKTNPNQVESSSGTKGLSFEYAMGWSNGTLDLFASFIPGVVGGGSSEPADRYENTLRNPQWQQFVQQYRQMPPLYWGSLPFTSGPIYFGAGLLLLFLIGAIVVKGPIKWWLVLGTVLTFLLSMGKNLEWFNELIFNYVPLYNKFRTPNSVLTVTSFLLPLLGFLGLSKIISGKVKKAEAMKSLKIAAGISGAILLFFALLGPSVFSFTGPGDVGFQQANFDLSPLIEDRKASMRNDAFRAFLIVAVLSGLIWFYLRENIKRSHLILGVGLVFLFDLWTIGKRYLDHDDFLPAAQATTLSPNAADREILADTQPNFRVFDTTDPNVFKSSRVSYFHKSLGGYHAAKLQRYQDVIDYHLTKGNQKVFNMLNTKYFIVAGRNSNEPVAQLNPDALGNAWFVNDIESVDSPNEEIEALTAFDPQTVAVVHREFSEYLQGLDPNKNGTIALQAYKPNELIYTSSSDSEQLAVFSEIWYGPDKGWRAYIDGEPADHIRANYLLRAMKIPAGQHEIVFRFDPPTYKTGKLISTISSLIVLLGLIGAIGFFGYRYIQKVKNQPPPKPPKTQSKKRALPRTGGSSKKKKKKKVAKPN